MSHTYHLPSSLLYGTTVLHDYSHPILGAYNELILSDSSIAYVHTYVRIVRYFVTARILLYSANMQCNGFREQLL